MIEVLKFREALEDFIFKFLPPVSVDVDIAEEEAAIGRLKIERLIKIDKNRRKFATDVENKRVSECEKAMRKSGARQRE